MKAKILIVDDEQINLDFFDVMLSRLGFVVERAADGEEGLEKVVSCKPDLIILDNIMPKLTGWEVTRKLKNDRQYRRFRGIPIIMFSAMDEVKDKIEGLELGVDDYITKPFNFSEVLARIRVALRHRELARQIARRERRLALAESLNKSLVSFARNVRGPAEEILNRAEELDLDDREAVQRFVSLIKKESQRVLAAVENLDKEVAELQSKGDRLKKGDLSPEDLERRLRQHLERWGEGSDGDGGDQ